MKPLAIWIAVVAVVFGGYALVTRNARDTEQVFVVVDSSFQMQPVWSDVRRELDRIDDAEYSEFALATEKEFIHSWQPELELVGVEPFAPCGFDGRRSVCRGRRSRPADPGHDIGQHLRHHRARRLGDHRARPLIS